MFLTHVMWPVSIDHHHHLIRSTALMPPSGDQQVFFGPISMKVQRVRIVAHVPSKFQWIESLSGHCF